MNTATLDPIPKTTAEKMQPNRALLCGPPPSPRWRELDEACDCSAAAIGARATTVTVVLEEILRGVPHGGINE